MTGSVAALGGGAAAHCAHTSLAYFSGAAGSPSAAVTMSSALVWELVKNNNAFIKKGLNGAVFSSEPGNL